MKLLDVKEYIKQVMRDNIDEAKHHQYPNSVFYTSENDGLKKALDKIEEYEQGIQKVTNVEYNSTYSKGCETCDYGCEYIKDMYITYDDRIRIHFHTNTKDESDSISEGDWMNGILNSNNAEELVKWYKDKMVPIVKDELNWKYPWRPSADIYYEIEDRSQEGAEMLRHYIGVDDK